MNGWQVINTESNIEPRECENPREEQQRENKCPKVKNKSWPQTFSGLVADGRGVGGVPLGWVQGGGHGGFTVLVVCPWVGVAQGDVGPQGEPLIVPGLAAAVALAVHGALVPLDPTLVLVLPVAWAGPPRLPGVGAFVCLGGAEQAGHGQHPLNGLFCAR